MTMDALDASIPGAVNFRDLGGLRTSDGGAVATGRLFRAGMTHHISDSGLQALVRSHGLRTVIDFRAQFEVERDGLATFSDHGIDFHHLPIQASTSMTPDQQKERWELMKSLQLDWAESYRRIVTEKPGVFVRFFELIANEAALPAVFHCAAGRDRTGIAAALVLGVLGVPDHLIAADYARTGSYLQPHLPKFEHQVRSMESSLEQFGQVLETTTDPMDRFIGWMRGESGSISAFVRDMGVDEATVNRTRSALLAPPRRPVS